MVVYAGSQETLREWEPYDVIFHPVEHRGGCWGWFYQYANIAPRFESYSDCTTKEKTVDIQRKMVDALGVTNKVALILPKAKTRVKQNNV